MTGKSKHKFIYVYDTKIKTNPTQRNQDCPDLYIIFFDSML